MKNEKVEFEVNGEWKKSEDITDLRSGKDRRRGYDRRAQPDRRCDDRRKERV